MALVEDGARVSARTHRQTGAHAEALVGLLDQALADAGWTRAQIDRVAVGVGPGSFTGLRVGIAFARGIAMGIDVPLCGVGSLEAMARAVPPEVVGQRWSMVDARRAELFVGAYSVDGREILAPRAVRTGGVESLLPKDEDFVVVGEALAEAETRWPTHRSPTSDLPHALWTGIAGASSNRSADPAYVREADAIVPVLPPSPLMER